jgi:hypothetical protein
MLNFQPASRDRLFYDRYEYGICISLPEAGCLRAKTHTEFLRTIQQRNSMRNSTYYFDHKRKIEGDVLDNLTAAFFELERCREHIKLIISYNILYIYSNDVKLLNRLAKLSYVRFNSAVQAVVDKPRDVVMLTDPKFRYRSYFRDRMLTEQQAEMIMKFFDQRKDTFNVTRAFRYSLTRYMRAPYIPRHLYVEHNDPKDITMLSLVMPGIIRKTLTVQAK